MTLESPVNDRRRLIRALLGLRTPSVGEESASPHSFSLAERQIAHINGSLYEHLQRTELLLRSWGCPERLSTAGLCPPPMEQMDSRRPC